MQYFQTGKIAIYMTYFALYAYLALYVYFVTYVYFRIIKFLYLKLFGSFKFFDIKDVDSMFRSNLDLISENSTNVNLPNLRPKKDKNYLKVLIFGFISSATLTPLTIIYPIVLDWFSLLSIKDFAFHNNCQCDLMFLNLDFETWFYSNSVILGFIERLLNLGFWLPVIGVGASFILINRIVVNMTPNLSFRNLFTIWKHGFVYGFGYFFFALYWVANASFYTDYAYILWPLMSIGLSMTLSIFFGFQMMIYGIAIKCLKPSNNWINIVIFSTIWFIFEYGRSIMPFGGFPWATLGQVFHYNHLLIQTLSIFGELGFGFFACFVSCGIVYAGLVFKLIHAYKLKLKNNIAASVESVKNHSMDPINSTNPDESINSDDPNNTANFAIQDENIKAQSIDHIDHATINNPVNRTTLDENIKKSSSGVGPANPNNPDDSTNDDTANTTKSVNTNNPAALYDSVQNQSVDPIDTNKILNSVSGVGLANPVAALYDKKSSSGANPSNPSNPDNTYNYVNTDDDANDVKSSNNVLTYLKNQERISDSNFFLIIGMLGLCIYYADSRSQFFNTETEVGKFFNTEARVIQLSLHKEVDKRPDEVFQEYLNESKPGVINIWPEDASASSNLFLLDFENAGASSNLVLPSSEDRSASSNLVLRSSEDVGASSKPPTANIKHHNIAEISSVKNIEKQSAPKTFAENAENIEKNVIVESSVANIESTAANTETHDIAENLKNSDKIHINLGNNSFKNKLNLGPKQLSIISGTIVYAPDYMSNAMVFLHNGNLDIYEKMHLVPFGEYLPLENVLPPYIATMISPFIGFFQRGSKDNVFVANLNNETIRFLPCICYEIIFSNELKTRILKAKEPIDAIVNSTNDSWYSYFPGKFAKFYSPGSFQHAIIASYRAIEFGVPVLRSASNGFSGIITPKGTFLERSNLDNKEILTHKIPKKIETLYSKYMFIEFYFVLGFIVLYLSYLRIIMRIRKSD